MPRRRARTDTAWKAGVAMLSLRRSGPVLILTALVFGLVGLALVVGGVWLAALGGSVYYVLAGLGIVMTAALLIARQRSALGVYAAVVIGTLVWAVSEVGFDWWPLAARGDVVFPLGIWLLTPWIIHRLHRDAGTAHRIAPVALLVAMALGIVVLIVGLARITTTSTEPSS